MRFNVDVNLYHISHGVDLTAATPGTPEHYKLIEAAKVIVRARLARERHLYRNPITCCRPIPCRLIGVTDKQSVIIRWRELGQAEKSWVSKANVWARKTFYEQQNICKSKYAINYHDGVKTHKDGSPFFDIALFKNKVKKNKFIQGLIDQGYEEKQFQYNAY